MSKQTLTEELTLERAIVHNPITVLPALLVSEAITLMSEMGTTCTLLASEPEINFYLAEARASCVLVVEETRPIGILTEREIIRLSASGQPSLNRPVSDVMSSSIFSIHPDNSLWQAYRLMQQRRLSHLVVIGDRGELVGFVTQNTLLQVLNPLQIYERAETLEQKAHQLEAEKQALLENGRAELESQIQQRTAALEAQVEQFQAELAARQRREQERQLLDAMIQSMSEVDDFDAALAAILSQICHATYWSFGEAWVPVTDKSCLQLSRSGYSDNPAWQAFREASSALCFAPNQGIPGRVWVAQQPEWVQDVSEQPTDGCLRVEAARHLGLKAALGVPILAKQDVVAVLLFFATDPHPLDVSLVQLITSVTAQVGPIIRRKQAEAALQRSEAELQALFRAMSDVVLVLDRAGRYIKLPLTEPTLLWAPAEELLGKTAFDIFPADLAERLVGCIQQVLTTQQPTTVEYCLQIQQQQRWFDASVSPLSEELVVWAARDITRRKQAEAALHQSEAINRALIESIPDLLIRVNQQGEYVELLRGGAVRKVLLPVRETANLTAYDILPKNLAIQRERAIQRAFATGELQVYEQPIEIDGQPCWEEVRITKVNDQELLVMIRDITDRKQAEAALRESEARFQAFMNNSPSASWITDEDGRVLYLSGTYLRTFQLPTEVLDDWIGTTVFDMYPADIAQQFIDNILRVTATKQVLETIEKAPRPDGTLGDYLVYKFPLQGISGQNLVGGVAVDITERVRAEQALQQLNQELEARVEQRTAAFQESEERLRQIFDQSPIGIAISDLEGHLTRVNASLATIMGCSASEMLQRSIQDFLPSDEQQSPQQLQQLLEQPHSVISFERQPITPNGQTRWVTVTSAVVFNASGHPSDLIYLIEDITDRKRIEEQLRKSEKHLCAAQRIAHLGSWEFELQTRKITWSQETYQIFGCNPEDGPPNYKAVLQLIHADDRNHHNQVFQQAIEQKQSYDLEYRFYRADGTLGYAQVRGEPILNAQQQPIHFVGTILDITQRKQSEEVLADYARKVEDLYNNAPCGYHSLDDAGRWVKINNTELHWLGYTREEVLGRRFVEFLTEDSQAIFWHHYSQLKQHGWIRDIEYDMMRKDGTILPVLLNATAVWGDDGTYLYSRSTLFDIHDRKAAELALKRQLAAIEAAIEGIAILQNETYTYLNQAHLRLFGYECSEELIGKSWKTLYSENEQSRLEQTIFPSLRQRGFWQGEATATRKDGSTFIQGLSFTLTESGAFICVCRNISEQKQTEQQLQTMNAQLTLANAELHRATRLKDEFLANMSHELRTPLNAVLGMSEALQEEVFGNLTDRQQWAIQTIERSGKHLLELINDILDLSKVEAGKLELQSASAAVSHLCESSLTFIRHQATKKNLHLQAEIPTGLPDIIVDERRIRQVLINLLSNAVKFTPEGGNVKLVVQTELHQGRHFLCFSVIDTGIGIAQADISHLFQPFFQIDSSLSRQYTGTGLGLALVSKLVELHGGTVSVTSELGQGSCFTVRLPYITASKITAIQATQLDTTPALLPSPCQAFIIEDSSAAAEQMTRYLDELGMQAIVYMKGEGAIEQARRTQPNLIILDILLPDCSGWEVLQQLKAHPETQNIPVLVVSVVDERSQALSLGAAEFLVKPITRKQLRSTLERLYCAKHSATTALMLAPIKVPSQPSSPPLILLVEDNEVNVVTISSYLSARGYHLILARNGHEAVTLAQAAHPNLILMDIQMPEMDGLAAIQQIRADPQFVDTPILALTALAMPGDQEKCAQAGANAYLTKPMKLKQLVETIQHFLLQK